jgi:hypothetical protein
MSNFKITLERVGNGVIIWPRDREHYLISNREVNVFQNQFDLLEFIRTWMIETDWKKCETHSWTLGKEGTFCSNCGVKKDVK